MKQLNNSQKTLFLLTFASTLIIIYMLNSTSLKKNSYTCTLYLQKCDIQLNEGPLQVVILEQLVVEELIPVKISLPTPLKVEQIHIEGINMYMGKSPVHQISGISTDLSSVQDEWVGEFFLGSCALAQMEWRMVVKLEGYDKAVNILFTTHQ